MPKLLPLSKISSHHLQNICLIATDMDGTLTTAGKFTSLLLQAFEDLAANGIKVLIVTGRSAGWVSGLASYLPIVGAIAENGGLFYPSGTERAIALTPIPDLIAHRQHLAAAFEQLRTKFPQLQEATDNRFRITDWTFSVSGLSVDELQTLDRLCQQIGWGFTYSNVQCHIQPLKQNKAVGLSLVLQQYFPEYKPEEVVTVGDSPNDENLFDQSYFPISVGVANIVEYAERLQHQPTYVTLAAEAEGFCELARLFIK